MKKTRLGIALAALFLCPYGHAQEKKELCVINMVDVQKEEGVRLATHIQLPKGGQILLNLKFWDTAVNPQGHSLRITQTGTTSYLIPVPKPLQAGRYKATIAVMPYHYRAFPKTYQNLKSKTKQVRTYFPLAQSTFWVNTHGNMMSSPHEKIIEEINKREQNARQDITQHLTNLAKLCRGMALEVQKAKESPQAWQEDTLTQLLEAGYQLAITELTTPLIKEMKRYAVARFPKDLPGMIYLLNSTLLSMHKQTAKLFKGKKPDILRKFSQEQKGYPTRFPPSLRKQYRMVFPDPTANELSLNNAAGKIEQFLKTFSDVPFSAIAHCFPLFEAFEKAITQDQTAYFDHREALIQRLASAPDFLNPNSWHKETFNQVWQALSGIEHYRIDPTLKKNLLAYKKEAQTFRILHLAYLQTLVKPKHLTEIAAQLQLWRHMPKLNKRKPQTSLEEIRQAITTSQNNLAQLNHQFNAYQEAQAQGHKE